MRIDVVETPDLGDRSYVITSGDSAVVVDPQRDIDRIERVLTDRGATPLFVLETHLHNDYVTGGLALARKTGATYVVAGRDDVAFERSPAHDGDTFNAGSLTVRVIETPGHTETHLSYVITDDGDQSAALFSGGSLLYGSVGRTDLVAPERTEELTREQWRSARKLAGLLPDQTPVYPTHGFGSFCSSGDTSGASSSTLGHEKQNNDALLDDEDEFVAKLIAGLTDYPSYYVHMQPLNAQGPGEPDLSAVSTLAPADLAARIGAGEWVIDLRDRRAYARHHLVGTVSIMMDDQFSTYTGWVIPWGAPITLIGESAEQVAQAQRQLVRIGIDTLAGSATGSPDSLAAEVPLSSYQVVTFAEVAQAGDVQVLDVRRADEVAQGRVAGSTHIALPTLADRLHEVPTGTIWVHCASGFRASIAASILARADHEVVLIDDDFSNAAKAGLMIDEGPVSGQPT